MNENLFDKAIDAAAKELAADAPDTLLKGVMYRIETDEKPKRFAFGRFTAIAAAAAAVVLIASLGGKYLGGSTAANNSADNMQNSAPLMQSITGASMDRSESDVERFSVGNDNTTASDSAAGVGPDTEDGAALFIAPYAAAITPAEQALGDYLTGREVVSIIWETELDAVVEIMNEAGETEKLKITLENDANAYRVVKEEKDGG